MKKIILAGLIAFLLAALWQLPLSYAEPHAKKHMNGLQMDNPSGTVWQGHAENVILKNHKLGKVNWQVLPLQSLLSFSLKSSFNVKSDDIDANGTVALTPTKHLILQDTRFNIDANYLNNQIKAVKLSGDFIGSIKHAKIDQKNVPIVDAIVSWRNGAVNSPMQVEPGNYRAVIAPVNNDLTVKLSSEEAPIELNGDIKLNNEWNYEANVNAKSNNQGLAGMLNLVGKQQADGSFLIQQKGDLKPFIGR